MLHLLGMSSLRSDSCNVDEEMKIMLSFWNLFAIGMPNVYMIMYGKRGWGPGV